MSESSRAPCVAARSARRWAIVAAYACVLAPYVALLVLVVTPGPTARRIPVEVLWTAALGSVVLALTGIVLTAVWHSAQPGDTVALRDRAGWVACAPVVFGSLTPVLVVSFVIVELASLFE